MLSELKPAILMTLVLTVLTGILYPLAITGLASVLFPQRSSGSLVRRADGSIAGSELIGQNFSKPGYFHPRPSAAGSNGYDATSSGGSNLGPTNPDLATRLQKDAGAFRKENPDFTGNIPSDAITTSGSGLDPDISPANALAQCARVARARGAAVDKVRGLVDSHTRGREFGLFGEPRVNVLELNLALDRQYPGSSK